MKTRRLDAALAIAMLLLVSSCAAAKNDTGSGGVASGPANPDATSAAGIYLGPLASPEVDTDAGIALAPPERLQPSVSWDAAYKTCATGESVCVAGVDPTISLALATSTSAGAALPNGALAPLMDDTLVYVMTWRDEPCVPKGGPPSSSGATVPTPQSCTLLAFVDATTGKALYGVEGPDIGK